MWIQVCLHETAVIQVNLSWQLWVWASHGAGRGSPERSTVTSYLRVRRRHHEFTDVRERCRRTVWQVYSLVKVSLPACPELSDVDDTASGTDWRAMRGHQFLMHCPQHYNTLHPVNTRRRWRLHHPRATHQPIGLWSDDLLFYVHWCIVLSYRYI